jgi:hypothetical protein
MKDQDLTVAAYVDGELDAESRMDFETEMARNPALREAVAAQRRLRQRLADTYAPVLAETTPLRLRMAAEAANDRSSRFGPAHWAAVAASLVAGVLVGRMALPESDPLAVSSDLAQALDRQLAADAGPIRIALSFRADDGRYCRTFHSAEDRRAGLACRDADGWRVRTVTAWTPPAGDYRTAGVATPPEVLTAVDALIAGETLDPAAERAARAHGWNAEATASGLHR